MAKKEFFRIITIFLVLFSLPFVIYFTDKEPNQKFCIDKLNYCVSYSELDKIDIKIINGTQFVLIDKDYINLEEIKKDCKNIKYINN